MNIKLKLVHNINIMKKFLKKVYIILLLTVLIITLIYVSNITNLPDRLILLEGEELKLKTAFGINIESQTSSKPQFILVSTDEKNSVSPYKINYEISLFGIKLKELNAFVIEQTEVVPLREFNRS